MPTALPSASQAVLGLRKHHPVFTDLLTNPNVIPTKQKEFIWNPELAFSCNYPTLTDLNLAYGSGSSVDWLMPQLEDLNDFCGVANKMDANQIEETAGIISVSYPYLKMSELMLFFGLIKQGRHGQFYGNLDPIKIMDNLREFVETYRAKRLTEIRQAEEERQRKEDLKKPHYTYEEWQQLKEQRKHESKV